MAPTKRIGHLRMKFGSSQLQPAPIFVLLLPSSTLVKYEGQYVILPELNKTKQKKTKDYKAKVPLSVVSSVARPPSENALTCLCYRRFFDWREA